MTDRPHAKPASPAANAPAASHPPDPWALYERILDCPEVLTVYVYGRPGVGKTYGAYHFGRVDAGFYAVTLTEDLSAAELRGHFLFRGGDAVWHDGPVVRAMREGKRLVLNELSHSGPDAKALLYPVLESVETAQLTLPTGETVRPEPGFHVVVTDNLAPDALPDALQDRFTCVLRVEDPHPRALDGLDPELRRAAERALAIDDDRQISARAWRNLQRLKALFGLEVACRLVFGPERGDMVYDALCLAEAPSEEDPPAEEAELPF